MVLKLALAILLGLLSSILPAQQAPSFGTDDVATYVVSAWDMQPTDSDVEWNIDPSNGHRYQTSSGGFIGVAHLPQGAEIVSMTLEACDTAQLGAVEASLTRTTFAGVNTLLAEAATSVAGTPGCVYVDADLATPVTVENNAYRYLVMTSQFGFIGDTLTIGAVRIRYRLQVSPPPPAATFGDVPTSDPAFQFVEALVASGITVGCGGGNYCPDAPLTRRQMAVFLAKGLGLHWPDGPLF